MLRAWGPDKQFAFCFVEMEGERKLPTSNTAL
jgi:hypothetical protein